MTPDQLRSILSRLGLPQTGAAKLLGVEDRTVRRWMCGETPVPETIARMVRMAEAGDLSLDALYAYRSSNFERPVDSEGGAVDEKPQIR